ncbi:SIMPL domain-containing protein [Streptomyces sp. TRM64462]|uniref:SIMPL domain-containing protein n=1 Tax=Streptomyces sp. TRM64462 TaxID=2741726 RepID=UPI0015865D1F|nr:SIMPL domain-containing protein [Streptomyces sp. TRM64462]
MATPENPRITVRGEARVDTAPDLARIGVVLTARGTDRRTVLQDLTRRNATAVDLIRAYDDALEDLETGALSLVPELARRGRGEHVRTFHGVVHLAATLTDFTALGELATRLADLDLTRVDGPWWSIRPTSPVHAEARTEAVRDAVRRARSYAQALGTDLAALVELDDTPPSDEPFDFGGAAPRAAAFGTEAAGDTPPPLDLEPRRQTVTAHITARFTLHPPATL